MDWAAIVIAIQGLSNIQILGLMFIFFLIYKSKDFILAIISKKAIKKKSTPCDTCIKPKLASDKAVQVFELKNIDLIRDQMVATQRLSSKIKSTLIVEFRKQGFNSKEVRFFRLVLDVAFMKVVDKIREWVLKNHLSSYSEAEFRAYVEDTIEELIEAALLSVDEVYVVEDFEKKFIPTPCIKDIEEDLDDALYALREISINYEKKIKVVKGE